MTVKEKIAQKKVLLAGKRAAQRKADEKALDEFVAANSETKTPKKLYTCVCKQCKIKYKTVNSLDLDELGRCPPCKKTHDAELEAMIRKFPQAPRTPELSYESTPGIEYNGIKFIPLRLVF